jgi:hypothetical protein
MGFYGSDSLLRSGEISPKRHVLAGRSDVERRIRPISLCFRKFNSTLSFFRHADAIRASERERKEKSREDGVRGRSVNVGPTDDSVDVSLRE